MAAAGVVQFSTEFLSHWVRRRHLDWALMPITHPPLTRAEFRTIVKRHRSAEALRLYCEIERLKAIERLVQEALALPAGSRRHALREQLLSALEGTLAPPFAFGITQKRSKAELRAQLANELGPMNYRDRARVVAAEATQAANGLVR